MTVSGSLLDDEGSGSGLQPVERDVLGALAIGAAPRPRGWVVDFLAQLGELDNTLIFVASDNGASAEGGVHGSFNELQFPNRVEATIEQNLDRLDEWGSVRSYPAQGLTVHAMGTPAW